MTDRPIIFSAPMIRAILDGRKTMTRRVIKPQPPANVTSTGRFANSSKGVLDSWSWLSGDPKDCDTWGFEGDFKARYREGDRLWVREGFFAHWGPVSGKGAVRIVDADIVQRDGSTHRATTGDPLWCYYKADNAEAEPRWKPSIHMPRALSRLTLEVTGVKVERLQDISDADLQAEGIPTHVAEHTFRKVYRDDVELAKKRCEYFRDDVWNNIHGNGAWEANPWVVAITFKTHRCNIDQMTKEAA